MTKHLWIIIAAIAFFLNIYLASTKSKNNVAKLGWAWAIGALIYILFLSFEKCG